MKFLHCADIHLDSPLRGLEKYAGVPLDEIRGASRRALENLVGLALQESVDFIVMAGDLFDGDWPDFNTGLFFTRQMVRLQDAGIKVFIVRGNHDADSKITRRLQWPENVTVLSANRPDTVILEEAGVAIHGQSFAGQSVSADLASRYPARIEGLFNLGLLHTSLDGREGHASYAPTKIDVLAARGYDYWALGHVHKREVVCREPLVLYPGNLQGRHIRETGAKGCELVTLNDGKLCHEQRVLNTVCWELLAVDVTGAMNMDDILNRVACELQRYSVNDTDQMLAARIHLNGRCPAYRQLAVQGEKAQAEIRALAIDKGRGNIWIEKIVNRTGAEFDISQLRQRDDPLGELIRELDMLCHGDDELMKMFGDELQNLQHKLPVELTTGDEAVRFDDPTYMQRLLAQVEGELLSRLAELE